MRSNSQDFPAPPFSSLSSPAALTDSEDQNNRNVALITGGSAGLGLVLAKTFLEADYQVIIIGRCEERLNAA
ncbi:MAG: SDR family NAD(P)-dependent oxidoreductase, partial [Planctomycetota bacterium]